MRAAGRHDAAAVLGRALRVWARTAHGPHGIHALRAAVYRRNDEALVAALGDHVPTDVLQLADGAEPEVGIEPTTTCLQGKRSAN